MCLLLLLLHQRYGAHLAPPLSAAQGGDKETAVQSIEAAVLE